MPDAEIRETTVTPDSRGFLAVLQISDAALLAEGAEIVIRLGIRLPKYPQPGSVLMTQFQREAILVAIAELDRIQKAQT